MVTSLGREQGVVEHFNNYALQAYAPEEEELPPNANPEKPRSAASQPVHVKEDALDDYDKAIRERQLQKHPSAPLNVEVMLKDALDRIAVVEMQVKELRQRRSPGRRPKKRSEEATEEKPSNAEHGGD